MRRSGRILTPWVAGFAIVTLVGIAVDAAQASRSESVYAQIAEHTAPYRIGRPIQAVAILQKSDCNGNLRMLHLLHRESVRDRMELRLLWYAGNVEDSTFIRRALPEWTRSTPLRPLPRSVFNQLHQLGHNETPMLIVLDQDGRIRLTTRSPRSSREFAGLLHIVNGLTWVEEL